MGRDKEEDRRAHTAREILHSSATNGWQTPEYLIQVARCTMGAIDLDPASSYLANERVCAQHIYTIEDDGLAYSWWGRVFLNPPYGLSEAKASNQGIWTRKLISEYESENVEQAVLLVNAVPDRTWFRALWNYAICFLDHRVRFIDPETGEPKRSPTHASVLVYFGRNITAFEESTSEIGHVVRPQRVRRRAA